MPEFVRRMLEPAMFKGGLAFDRDLKNHEVYGKYFNKQQFQEKSLTKNVSVKLAIHVGRQVLGDTLWCRLLKLGGDETLNTSAEIIEDFLAQHDQYKNKDLQLSLVVNIVKEVAVSEIYHKAKYCELAENFIRKLALEPNFKHEVENQLLNTGAIYEPWLIIVRQAA